MSQAPLDSRFALQNAIAACRSHFIGAAIYSALLNLLYLAPTIYMLQIYDRVVPTRGVTTLLFLTLIFTFAVATLSGLDHVRSRLLIRASLRLDRLMSPPILNALIARVDGVKSSQVLREFDVLRVTLTGQGVLALFDAPWTPIYIVICFLISPWLGTLAMIGSALLIMLAVLNERTIKTPLKLASQSSAQSYIALDQSASVGGVVRALGMRRALVARHLYDRQTASHLTADANYASGSFITLTKFIRLLLQSLSLGLGAYLAVEQKISMGSIFAASLLVNRALSPVEQVVGTLRSAVQAAASWRSVRDLITSSPVRDNHTLLPPAQGALAVERLSVLNPTRDRLLLHDVSFSLQKGEALGVVGPSGAGKSTMIKAVAGALSAANGMVRLDGANADDWNEDQLARAVGYAPQDPTLFAGTVKENICRFQTFVEDDQAQLDEAVIRAAILCGAHEFILRLPQAYETVIGFGGAGLSAGQAQRIALARAFYGSPKYVFMDEPNAHLDSAGEADLVSAISSLKADGVTVIIVAHRIGILANVDKLMVLREGRMELFGPRDEIASRLEIRRQGDAVDNAPLPVGKPE
jgi:ATP-binding cassette subfamily C protein